MRFFLPVLLGISLFLTGCCFEKAPQPTQAYLLTVWNADTKEKITTGRIVARFYYDAMFCPWLSVKSDIDLSGQARMKFPEVGYRTMSVDYEYEDTSIAVTGFFLSEFPESDFDAEVPSNVYINGEIPSPRVKIHFQRVFDANSTTGAKISP